MSNIAEDFPATVAAAVSRAIAISGMPLTVVSARSGIAYSTLSRRLSSRGKSPFDVAEIGALAIALNVHPLDLMVARREAAA